MIQDYYDKYLENKYPSLRKFKIKRKQSDDESQPYRSPYCEPHLGND
jgi:hypothetical protein